MNKNGKEYGVFQKIIKNTHIIKLPKKSISTFGKTIYTYYLLCPTRENETIIHEGSINVSTPLIISLYSIKNNLYGFEEGIRRFTEKMFREMGVNSPLLEYQFQHVSRENWKEKEPLFKVLNNIKKSVENDLKTVILIGNEKMWSACLIKACLKIIKRSIPHNLEEWEERGFLDEQGIPSSVYKEIERLFDKAQKNKKYLEELGSYLLRHNVFERYEKRFFTLYPR